MKIIECQQGTNEWLQARLGLITASEADALVTPLGKVKTGEAVETYLIKKVCEKFLGYTTESVGTFEMQQGSLIESVAIPYFEFTTGLSVKRVGLCVSELDMCACSPDGLIGDEGGLEVKSPQPEKALRTLLGGVVPPEHVIQVQFSLYVSQRKWWKYLSFSRHFSPLIIHVEPDPKIQEAIYVAVAQFASRFDVIMKKLTDERDSENALKSAAYEASLAKS